MGIPIGTGFGVALGLALDNLALGIAIGACMGVSIGAALDARRGETIALEGSSSRWALVLAGIGLLVLTVVGSIAFLLIRSRM